MSAFNSPYPFPLGLLGALSIVRFRTPIKEPEEVGFILLLIASSIGIATFNFAFVGILYVSVFLILLIRTFLRRKKGWLQSKGGVLLLNMDQQHFREKGDQLNTYLGQHFSGLRLESINSTEGTANLQFIFNNSTNKSWSDFERNLKEVVPYNQMNLYLSKSSDLL